jgi:hypothetical protein
MNPGLYETMTHRRCRATPTSPELAAGALLITLAASHANAQSGILRYGPSSQDVPTMGTLAIGLLGIAIAGLAYAGLGKNVWRCSRHLSLIGAALVAGLSVLAAVHSDRILALAVPVTSLSQPAGGTVTIPTGLSQFRNDTAILQRIRSMSSPCANGSPNMASSDACAVGVELAPGALCDSQYSC